MSKNKSSPAEIYKLIFSHSLCQLSYTQTRQRNPLITRLVYQDSTPKSTQTFPTQGAEHSVRYNIMFSNFMFFLFFLRLLKSDHLNTEVVD